MTKGQRTISIASKFNSRARAVVFQGDCRELIETIPAGRMRLVVTSPPYNIGKVYEKKKALDHYLQLQREVICACTNALAPGGSLCWEVGNYITKNSILPLDIPIYQIATECGLTLRNRIVWHFEHGLHCSKRFSGRYETILWFTKGDDYYFDLDPIRIPQKYPNKKHYKGPKAGALSCNPLGKNPGDVWVIPNVKHNHVEKTEHPCQFPVELVERLILSMTREGDWVLDPFMGVGTTLAAAIKNKRRGAGAEIVAKYVKIAQKRIREAAAGTLRTRPIGRPVYEPPQTDKKTNKSGRRTRS